VRSLIRRKCDKCDPLDAKETRERIAMHIPVGMWMMWLLINESTIGIILSIGFFLYEVIEDWRLKDSVSHVDIMGWIVGAGVIASYFVLDLLGVAPNIPIW
jgi:uncharacterized membrane protein